MNVLYSSLYAILRVASGASIELREDATFLEVFANKTFDIVEKEENFSF